MTALTVLDLIGVFVFAVSGAIAAQEKEMDILGMFVLAAATGLGGGTIRSIVTGVVPPPVLVDPWLLGVCAGATVLAFFAKRLWERMNRAVSVFDAFGLGLFVCLGMRSAQAAGLEVWAVLLMGVVSGTFGGVIRDVLRNEIPLLLRREIYATAAAAGGVVFLLMQGLAAAPWISITVSTTVTATIRLIAIQKDLHLPGTRR